MRRISLRHICSAIVISVCCIVLAFVISNSDDNARITELQSVKCDCPLTLETVRRVIPTVSTINPNAVRFATCKDIEKTSPVQRAIIIYYPHHQSEYFFPEVRW